MAVRGYHAALRADPTVTPTLPRARCVNPRANLRPEWIEALLARRQKFASDTRRLESQVQEVRMGYERITSERLDAEEKLMEQERTIYAHDVGLRAVNAELLEIEWGLLAELRRSEHGQTSAGQRGLEKELRVLNRRTGRRA